MKASKYPMVSVDEALAMIMNLTPVLESELVPIDSAAGRVLAEDVFATENLPPFPASSVDGYAVLSADGNKPRRVIGELTAGSTMQSSMPQGSAVRIMTGAPLPAGADSVTMVENTVETDGLLTFGEAPRAGNNVIPVGLDVTAGQRVLGAGTWLGHAEVALLATVGKAKISVHRVPVVAVLSTGDELVEPGTPLAAGKIRDSNRYGLLAAIVEAHGRPLSLGTVGDDLTLQEERLCAGLAAADVAVTSGGVSVGSRDLIKGIFERLGRVHFGRVAMKPGKPFTFATADSKLLFGLPGFPVSSLVTFELFVRPTLLRMQGLGSVARPAVDVVLDHDISRATDGRVEFQRAVVRHVKGRLFASTTGRQASSRVLSLIGANALLRIEPGEDRLPAGTTVPALLLGELNRRDT